MNKNYAEEDFSCVFLEKYGYLPEIISYHPHAQVWVDGKTGHINIIRAGEPEEKIKSLCYHSLCLYHANVIVAKGKGFTILSKQPYEYALINYADGDSFNSSRILLTDIHPLYATLTYKKNGYLQIKKEYVEQNLFNRIKNSNWEKKDYLVNKSEYTFWFVFTKEFKLLTPKHTQYVDMPFHIN